MRPQLRPDDLRMQDYTLSENRPQSITRLSRTEVPIKTGLPEPLLNLNRRYWRWRLGLGTLEKRVVELNSVGNGQYAGLLHLTPFLQ